MKLIFERGNEGRRLPLFGKCDVPEAVFDNALLRKEAPALPKVSEVEIDRHYFALSQRTFGVCDGMYPLGSCTMKYNPAINEITASLPGFKNIHPLQDDESVPGAVEVLKETEDKLAAICGMDHFTFQPAAGAHGEFTGVLMIKGYHEAKGDTARTKIIVPDSAHGTNPASAAMCGFDVVNIPSDNNGLVDLEALKEAVGDDTAGLMLTNPNTVGLFDENILEITKIVHEAGGLCYYDGANLNAIMGTARPGDMGFDVMHLNLHKTFSTPHGGGGPGSGAVGYKDFLKPYGSVHGFHGNFLVVVKALTYLLVLGKEGVLEASRNAVLNANYMKENLKDILPAAYDRVAMHEFVISLDKLKAETGVSALDFAKAMQEYGLHPPTMYFPLIVHEALMIEPTETETKESLDEAIAAIRDIYERAFREPEYLHETPHGKPIGRPDEVTAARNPVLRYVKPD